MRDAENPRESFIFELSGKDGMDWFEEVILVSSPMDSYSPFDSSRIQLSKANSADDVKAAPIFREMVSNITKKFSGRVRRVDVCMGFESSSIETMIGRAAHIFVVSDGILLELLSSMYSKFL